MSSGNAIKVAVLGCGQMGEHVIRHLGDSPLISGIQVFDRHPERMKRLKELVGVSRRTVLRWRDWWCTVFTMSPFWRAHRGTAPAARDADLPDSLLKSFTGATSLQQLISLLRFLVPSTTGRGILRAI